MRLVGARALLALFLALAPVVAPTALAQSPAIARTGVPDVDKLFGEVGGATGVLDAAEQRMDGLLSEVASPLGLPATTTIAASVWHIRQRAKDDVRVMMADGRPILALGSSAPSEAKQAAGALNEGTQELAVIAQDIARMPDRLSGLADRAEALSIDAATLQAAGVDGSKLADVRRQLSDNVARTRTAASRAKIASARAQAMLDAVKEGMAATSEPGAPKPEPKPEPVAPTPEPAPEPAPRAERVVPTVKEVVDKAWAQFNDAEIAAAVDLLAEADLLLPRQTRPVSRNELIELFQIRGLVNLVQGDATAAAWSAAQALVIHPNATPLAKLGPDYARLHKAIAKAGVVRKVDVRVKGEGRAYLSGIEVTSGSTVQLGQGQHLLQVEKGGTWRSSVVYVREGFVVEF